MSFTFLKCHGFYVFVLLEGKGQEEGNYHLLSLYYVTGKTALPMRLRALGEADGG